VGFLKHLGIDGDAVREAMYHQYIYQAVMRTSLRDTNASAPVRVVLCDKKSAEALGRMFPGSTVSKMNLGIIETPVKPRGRPKLSKRKSDQSKNEKTRTLRHAIQKEIARLENGGQVNHKLMLEFGQKGRCDNLHLQKLKQLATSKANSRAA
jgi:hypothetical protein